MPLNTSDRSLLNLPDFRTSPIQPNSYIKIFGNLKKSKSNLTIKLIIQTKSTDNPNTDEWQYYLEGTGRMTVFAFEHNARTFDFSAGDVGAVPFAYDHYIENTSAEVKLRFLEVFKSPQLQDVSLNQWMALTPPELIKQHLNLSDKAMNSLRKEKSPVVKYADEDLHIKHNTK